MIAKTRLAGGPEAPCRSNPRANGSYPMAEKAEGDTTPEAQKRRAETIPQFFQIGLRPEGPLGELLRFWEVTKGTDFHSGRLEVLVKTLVRKRALEIIGEPKLFRWKLRGGWSADYVIWSPKMNNKSGEPSTGGDTASCSAAGICPRIQRHHRNRQSRSRRQSSQQKPPSSRTGSWPPPSKCGRPAKLLSAYRGRDLPNSWRSK